MKTDNIYFAEIWQYDDLTLIGDIATGTVTYHSHYLGYRPVYVKGNKWYDLRTKEKYPTELNWVLHDYGQKFIKTNRPIYPFSDVIDYDKPNITKRKALTLFNSKMKEGCNK